VTGAGTAFARKVSGARGAQLCDLLDENVLHSALVPMPRQRRVDVLAETW
jgi:hypothetical protein